MLIKLIILKKDLPESCHVGKLKMRTDLGVGAEMKMGCTVGMEQGR